MNIPNPLAVTGISHRLWRRSTSGAWTFLNALLSPKMSPGFFFLDFAVYPLLITGFLFIALRAGGIADGLLSMAIVISGYVFWTLAEYLVHRYVLHHVPVFAAVHLAHHHAPRDLIGTPTLLSAAMFLGLGFWPMLELTSLPVASAWMAGLLAGYLSYVAVHYAVHHFGSGGHGLLKGLKRHHALHHYRDGHHNFGVTTGIWDRVFATLAA